MRNKGAVTFIVRTLPPSSDSGTGRTHKDLNCGLKCHSWRSTNNTRNKKQITVYFYLTLLKNIINKISKHALTRTLTNEAESVHLNYTHTVSVQHHVE